jgi:hypothetical protein
MIGVAITIISSMSFQRTCCEGLLVSIKEKALTFSSVFPVGSTQDQVNLFELVVEKAIAICYLYSLDSGSLNTAKRDKALVISVVITTASKL